jgi:prepilin peptidase CpaA
MIAYLPALIFLGLLSTAALSDIASMKIPNWISIVLASFYPVLALAFGTPLSEIGLHILAGAAMLVFGFVLFQFRIIGGGDAKVLAAAAVWTGFEALMPFGYWTVLAGGALALALLIARGTVPPHPYFPSFAIRLLQPTCGIPYGVAICVGGVAALSEMSLTASALTLP